MTSSGVKLVIILEQKWPVRGIKSVVGGFWLDQEVALSLDLSNIVLSYRFSLLVRHVCFGY